MTVKRVKKEDIPESKITFAGIPIKKRDTQIVVQDNLLYEDQYSGLYWSQANPGNMLIEPPFNPTVLVGLVTKNNILAQCISAMEVNIDGTGWSIEPRDNTENLEPDKDYQMLEAFFNEPYPDVGFITQRRRLRYDLECTGNAYLEVLRNLSGDIVFLRWVDSTTMRLVKLDEPVEVEKEITRNGKVLKAKMMVRERRFAQRVGEKMLYFREFGASRNLSRSTCVWEGAPVEEGGAPTTVEPDDMATEIIHLTLEPDAGTAYGVPRWINQLPSVLGSRKAEEFNLTFFDSGGIPPVAIFVQGGSLAGDVMEQLKGYFNGDAQSKHRAAIVEVQSTSGSLDKGGSVQVKTERFGETKSDSMFQEYDKNTEEHIRVSFRLPPMFLGRSQDYNFATAMTGYMVTEAQVFAPERLEFDEKINMLIVRSLGVDKWVMKSKPMTIKNVEVQLQAMELVSDKIDPEEMVGTVNDIASLDLKFDKETYDKNREMQQPAQQDMAVDPETGAAIPAKPAPTKKPPGKVVPIAGDKDQGSAKLLSGPKPSSAKKSEDLSTEQVVRLVNEWSVAMGLDTGEVDDPAHVLKLARDLSPEQRAVFNNVLATKAFVNAGVDAEGLAEIAECCAHVME